MGSVNNEPVAIRYDFDGYGYQYMDSGSGSDWQYRVKGEPLYTHPVNPKYDPETGEPLIDGYPLFSGLPHPVKELTDEEICKIFNEHTGLGIHQKEADKADLLVFARAILRKAQSD